MPRCLRPAICSAVRPSSRSTPSVSCPRAGALRRCRPGVAESLGTMPGTVERAAVRHLDLLQHAARLVVRVGGDVRHGVDAAGRHGGGVQRRQHLGHRALRRPLADRCVDLVDARHAAGVVGQCRVGAQVGAADRRHQALEDAVAVAGDQHVAAVAAAVGVGRRDAGQRAAGRARAPRRRRCTRASRLSMQLNTASYSATSMTWPCAPLTCAVLQRHQDADHAVQRRQRVADARRPRAPARGPARRSGGAGRPSPRPPRRNPAGRGTGRSGRSR